MSRAYEYINISTPKVRAKPGLSHDLQLLQDLEIANARTMAELGPLPSGGLPAVPKRRVDAKGWLLPEAADNSTTEDEAMKWNQVAAVAAMAAGMAACEPSPATSATEQPLATTQVSSQAEPSPASTKQADIAVVEVSKVQLRSSYAQCLNAAGGATWSMQDCIEKEWNYQDARLNAAYQKLKAKLPKAQWEPLQAEQREWIIDRDHSEVCKWDAATEGQAQRIAANECTLLQVASRADKLEKLLVTESEMP